MGRFKNQKEDLYLCCFTIKDFEMPMLLAISAFIDVGLFGLLSIIMLTGIILYQGLFALISLIIYCLYLPVAIFMGLRVFKFSKTKKGVRYCCIWLGVRSGVYAWLIVSVLVAIGFCISIVAKANKTGLKREYKMGYTLLTIILCVLLPYTIIQLIYVIKLFLASAKHLKASKKKRLLKLASEKELQKLKEVKETENDNVNENALTKKVKPIDSKEKDMGSFGGLLTASSVMASSTRNLKSGTPSKKNSVANLQDPVGERKSDKAVTFNIPKAENSPGAFTGMFTYRDLKKNPKFGLMQPTINLPKPIDEKPKQPEDEDWNKYDDMKSVTSKKTDISRKKKKPSSKSKGNKVTPVFNKDYAQQMVIKPPGEKKDPG